MVSSGLKIGDTFTDGGFTYEIKAVLPDGNYISKRVTDVKVEKEVKPAARSRKKQ